MDAFCVCGVALYEALPSVEREKVCVLRPEVYDGHFRYVFDFDINSTEDSSSIRFILFSRLETIEDWRFDDKRISA